MTIPAVETTMGGGAPPTREPNPRWTETNLKTGEVRSVAQQSIIAIDPGDEHCGMALGIISTSGEFGCVRAWEATPNECADEVAAWLLAGELQAVVVERFSLYADKAQTQIGSSFPTAELIGVLKYLVRIAGSALLVVQGADIKKSMRAQLKARGISTIPAEADHARDAQLHLWHYAGRELLKWGEQ